MDGGRTSNVPSNLSGHISGRVISACFALSAFAVAILAGLASDNPASSVLSRALLAMIFCYPLGLVVGMVCQNIITAHIAAHQDANPAPDSAASEHSRREQAAAEQPLVV